VEYGQKLTFELLSEAQEYTRLGYVVVPTKNKQPIIKWTERRGIIATAEELQMWFGINNTGIEGIGIVLDASLVVIETDGTGEATFCQKILPKLSAQTQEACRNTTHTRSPNGNHRLFRINSEDYPHNVKEITCNLSMTAAMTHDEIKLLSQKKYINERGPGYEKVNGIEHIARLSNEQVTELVSSIERLRSEIGAIRTVATSLAPYYKQPNRDNLVFAVSGFLHKGGVSEQLIKATIDYLIDIAGSHDEKKSRLKVVEDTCAKLADSDQVSGYAKLLEAVENNQGIPDELQQVFAQLGYFVNAMKRSTDNKHGIPLEILAIISPHVYSVVGENPITLFIADNKDKKLKKAIIGTPKRGYGSVVGNNTSTTTTTTTDAMTSTTRTKTNLQYMVRDTIIDAIPIRVIINDNPLDDTKTYELTFVHNSSRRPFTVGPGSVSYIITELQNKGRYIKDKETATQALQAILVEYEDLELAEINNRVPYSGYFYIDGRIMSYDTTQFDKIAVDSMNECIDAFEELYAMSKDREILVTSLKWGLVAPFSYVRKQMGHSGDWIPGLYACGKTQTGKSTKGKFVLGLWRLLGTKFVGTNFLGFGHMSTEARLCKAVGRNTYPVIFNEVSALATDKYKDQVELCKHIAENTTSRAKYNQDRRYGDEQALSNCIFTSNAPPPQDAGFRLRYRPLSFEKGLETTDEEKKRFNNWWDLKSKKFGIFGDFAARYIIQNPSLLKEIPWYELGSRIICDFYNTAGKTIPEWIDILQLSDVVEESNENTFFEIRAFFEQEVIDAYRKDPIHTRDEVDRIINAEISFEQKLDHCIKQRLIPYLHYHFDKKTNISQVIITQNVISELHSKKISNMITLQSLSDEIEGFRIKSMRINNKVMKVAAGSYDHFLRFISFNLEDDT
jgi:hypothetical protein